MKHLTHSKHNKIEFEGEHNLVILGLLVFHIIKINSKCSYRMRFYLFLNCFPPQIGQSTTKHVFPKHDFTYAFIILKVIYGIPQIFPWFLF